MIKNDDRIQSILKNIIDKVTIIRDDFLKNDKVHYDYILEKLEQAKWDLNVIIKMAQDEKGKNNES